MPSPKISGVEGRGIVDVNLGIFALGSVPLAITAISTKTIATISGAGVWLTGILGIVTTVVQSQANAAKLIATPTVGTAIDICATLDINAAEVGAVYSITGLASDAMTGVTGGTSKSGSVAGQTRKIYIAPGTLGFNTAASSTGAIQWYFWWLPVGAGNSLAAGKLVAS